jgi:anti-anti-sigma factor
MTHDPGRPELPGGQSTGGRLPGPGADTGSGQERPPVLDQAFDADSLYTLRAAVAAHASQAGMPEGRVGDLVLAVHELAANAVWHGAGHGRLRFWKSADAVVCEVSDDGAAGGDPGDRGPADVAGWSIEFGHGLWLVRQIADQASIRTGTDGTVAVVSFALGPAGQRPPFHLDWQDRDGCTILSVTGQLDKSSAGQFVSAALHLAQATPTLRLLVDLSGLTWWDSVGLAALITVQEQLQAHPGARMALAGPPGRLLQRLRDADPRGQLTVARTTAEAARLLLPDDGP